MTAKASFDQDMIRSQIDTMDHISHGSGVAPSTFQYQTPEGFWEGRGTSRKGPQPINLSGGSESDRDVVLHQMQQRESHGFPG